jgi:hypothetical protein
MNSQDKLSLEVLEQPPGTNPQTLPTEQPAAIAQERLPGGNAEAAPANHPSLLESFYHWLMSRS